MHELAGQSLDLVNRELAATLETARGEIEDFVDGQSDAEALVRAASLLHLAAGALKIVEIHGAALLAEEMEQACRVIHEARGENVDRGIEALTRAMVQLPAYLDRLLAGGSDVALVLLPLLNDLRNARGQPMLSEGTLLLLNTGPFERLRRPAQPGEATRYGKQLPALAQKLRPRFQSALLKWIRGEGGREHLKELIDACDALGKVAESEPVRQLWAVTAGVLVALASGSLEPTVQLKRLLGQADRQLKRLIDSGEQGFVSAPPVDLLNSLLYYVARAPGDDPRLKELRQAFGVAAAVPAAAEIEQAREDLAGPSVKLMRTVADAIKEDLAQVKDALDIFVRTGMQDVAGLKTQLDMLKKIGDTLGVLGLETARTKIQGSALVLGDTLSRGKVGEPLRLEKIAASLLEVEDMLDRELVKAHGREAEEADAQSPEEALESSQVRHVTQAVMRECIVNLARIKEAVVKVLDDPGAVKALDSVGPQLRGIVAGLLMLNKNKAVNVIERIGRNITTRLAAGGQTLKASLVERLADAIVSIEYYMETVALGRADPNYMLDNATRCLDLVEGAAAKAEARGAAERPPSAPAATPTPTSRPAAAPARPAAQETPEDHIATAVGEIFDRTVADDRKKPLPVMQVEEERSEPELVEIFIEEAKDELEKIRALLPRWVEQPADSEALIGIRRSFHTLKGSGRVVGAQLIGEFAWGIENLLNRVINQTLPAEPKTFDLIREAVDALPALIEQLEIGIRPPQDISQLIARAHALAEGRDAGDTAIEERVAAPAEQAGDTSMDPVLRQIFVKEVREHLATIRRFAAEAAALRRAAAITEALHRACHTLYGSARMAACAPAIALAEPLDRKIREGFEQQLGLGTSALAVLGRFADAFDRLSAELESGAEPATDAQVVAAIAKLELALPASATDETGETPLPDFAGLAVEDGVAADEAEEPDEPEPVEAVADYDPEIAAIFCEEAAELLDGAETELSQLKQGAGAEAAVAGLMRLMHTLKGGARLAGIAAMGDLSHALETMLPQLESASADSRGVSLAQQALDQLQHMRDAVAAGQGAAAARELIGALENFAGAEAPAAAEPARPAPVPPRVAAAAPARPAREAPDETRVLPGGVEPTLAEPDFERELALDDTRDQPRGDVEDTRLQPALAAAAAPAPAPAPTPAAAAASATPAAAEAPTAAPAAAAALESPATPRTERAETARVDATLLDELLNGAGEISIFQSRLNQQVHATEHHLGELAQTVTRLREQLRTLEAETEAQILHRHQGEVDADTHFDPLELDRYSTIQQLSRALAESANDVASINELLQGLTSETDTLLTQQSRVTTQLQDGLMQTRMVPFDRLTTRLARIVRQAASDTGKEAELEIDGEKSQLDRQILDAIVPALEHLLRNAVVHGIESPAGRAAAGKPARGEVRLGVRREGSEVIIDVADDGAGLDLKAIRRKAVEKGLIKDGQKIGDDEVIELILLPGFSTADELTQAAGRGVGMDVVENEVKRLGGSLRIDTTAGKGTRFLMRLPYTLAITHALIVNVGEESFALPLPTVEGIARVRREQLLEILKQDDPRLTHGDGSYRVQHLGSLVGSAPSALPEDEGAVSLVLVRAGENSTALLTDMLEGSREIVVKTMGPHIASVPGVTGATILGDGRIVVILDAATLVRAQHREREERPSAPVDTARQLTALVVDDSITMRRVTQRLLERRGLKVVTARDGLDAIEVLREHEADVILLDIEMPRMDGYQFATHVRNDAKLKDMPIIMVTSRSGEKHRARAIEIGVNDYLSKPYQEGELVAAIGALLGRKL